MLQALCVRYSEIIKYQAHFLAFFDFPFFPDFLSHGTYALGPYSVATNFLNEALYQRFFMWFSDLDELKNLVLISTHRFPSCLWPFHNLASSSFVKGMWLMFGFKWLTQRSRICFPTRPGNFCARSDHLVNGCSLHVVTASMTIVSSWSCHCPFRTPGFKYLIQRSLHSLALMFRRESTKYTVRNQAYKWTLNEMYKHQQSTYVLPDPNSFDIASQSFGFLNFFIISCSLVSSFFVQLNVPELECFDETGLFMPPIPSEFPPWEDDIM